jgi:hypothetical protein
VSYTVTTRWGSLERRPSETRCKEILAELDAEDREHPDAWLTHESGWSLAAHESGLLVWENVEADAAPRFMRDVPRQRVLELWWELAAGKIDELDREPWTEHDSAT